MGTTAPRGPFLLWTGRVLSALPVLALLMSASMKLTHAPQFLEMWTSKLGFPESARRRTRLGYTRAQEARCVQSRQSRC